MKPALITTPDVVAREFEEMKHVGETVPLIAISGGFDPFHLGHLRYIQAAALLKGNTGRLVVIVNGDGFLERKKGYAMMPLAERMELVSAFQGVDFVVPWDDGSQTVTECIRIIQPNIFAKGGSKTCFEDIPEYDVCKEVGCNVVFGIGGSDKVHSSTELVARAVKDVK